MNLNENRIRDLAYQIWESEGRPHGQATRHWDIACKLASDTPLFDSPRQLSGSIPESRRTPANQQQVETKPAGKTRKSKTDTTSQMG